MSRLFGVVGATVLFASTAGFCSIALGLPLEHCISHAALALAAAYFAHVVAREVAPDVCEFLARLNMRLRR